MCILEREEKSYKESKQNILVFLIQSFVVLRVHTIRMCLVVRVYKDGRHLLDANKGCPGKNPYELARESRLLWPQILHESMSW